MYCGIFKLLGGLSNFCHGEGITDTNWVSYIRSRLRYRQHNEIILLLLFSIMCIMHSNTAEKRIHQPPQTKHFWLTQKTHKHNMEVKWNEWTRGVQPKPNLGLVFRVTPAPPPEHLWLFVSYWGNARHSLNIDPGPSCSQVYNYITIYNYSTIVNCATKATAYVAHIR